MEDILSLTLNLETDVRASRDTQARNILKLKEVVAKGLLGVGRPVVIVGETELRIGRVISFPVEQYRVDHEKTPGVVFLNDEGGNHTDGAYVHLEVEGAYIGLGDIYYALEYAMESNRDWAPGILHLAEKQGLLDWMLGKYKGKVLYSSSSSHHSGTSSMCVVSMGEAGVALYEYREDEILDYDEEDEDLTDDDKYTITYTSDGNLYSYDVDFDVSVKRGSSISSTPIRPLTDKEKQLLLNHQPLIEFILN